MSWLPLSPDRPNLLLFVAPDCGICSDVLDGMPAITARSDAHVAVVVEGEPGRAASYVRGHGIRDAVVIHDPDGSYMRDVGIHDTPYALLLDDDGTVVRAGIVNTGRQVEVMLDGLPRPVAA